MSVADLLDDLKALDVKLWCENETLKFDAPAGVLDAQLRERIKSLKPELIRVLANEDVDTSGLSPGQKRIWFHEKILTNGGAYQIPGAIKIKGLLKLDILESAFCILIDRHDALRLAITEGEGKPVASYAEKAPFTLDVVELNEAAASSSRLEQSLGDFLAEPFQMDVAPLMKCRVFRQDSQNHILAISLHHIISDGWSVALFVDQLTAVYQDLYKGVAPARSQMELGYRDYVAMNNRSLRGQKKSLEEFWSSYLEGASLQFDFPSDRVRPPIENDAGNEISMPLDAALMQGITELARESGCTLFALLLGAFATLLHRLTGEDDLVIGTAYAGRNDPAYHSVIGLFANTFPIRCKLDSEESFRDFLVKTKGQALKALEHAETPFDWIVNAVNPPRDLSRPPVYQVMFNFLNQPKANPALPDCELEMVVMENTSSKVDLTLAVEERDGNFSVGIEYKTDLYDESRIQALLKNYSTLLESIVSDADSKLSKLQILTDSERDLVLHDWNRTSVEFDRSQTLVSILDQKVADESSAAFVFNSSPLSYERLRQEACKLAWQLVKRGGGEGMIVAVMLERGLQYPVAVFGILQSGSAFLPIAPDCPPDRLEYILADAAADILIVSREMEMTSGEFASRIICIEDLLEGPASDSEVILPEVDPHQLAYCVYTSGTTGNPKGVEITHAAVLNLLHALAEYPGLPDGCSMLAIAPFYFDMSIPDIFLPVFAGGTGVILEEQEGKSPESINAIAAECSYPVMQATASTLRMLLAQGWRVPSHLRIWCGGEAFPADLAGQLSGKCEQLINIYGPTETTVWSTASHVSKVENPLPVGKPLQNTRIYVLDRGLNLLPPGYPGELHIAGEGVARGYRNNPELTDEKFIMRNFPALGDERLYKTGDLARWNADGNLEILGRIDAQLKILGHRIEPAEIEAVLTNIGEINEAAVTTARDSSGEWQLAAFIACGEVMDHQAIRTELRKKLPPYMEPRWICEMDALPRSANGKLDRKALPTPVVEVSFSKQDDVPVSGVELRMHKLWSKVMQQGSIGREQNFFDVGGHSLLAIHLLAEVKKEFGVSVPVVNFLGEPTIAGLCKGMSQSDSAGARLVELSQVQSATPLILVPGASGNPYSYQAVAEGLAPGIKLVGITPAGFPESKAHTIEEVAGEYIDLLGGKMPEEDYHLIGHSYGGAVVFEMAQQLIRQGGSVATLTIIDLPAKPYLSSDAIINDIELLAEIAEAAQVFSGASVDRKADFTGLEINAAKRLLLDVLEQSGMIPSQDDLSLGDSLLLRYRASRVAMQSYTPESIGIPIHVIRCAETDFDPTIPESLGWDNFTTSGVRTFTVSGSHISMITGEHAVGLADEITSIVNPIA